MAPRTVASSIVRKTISVSVAKRLGVGLSDHAKTLCSNHETMLQFEHGLTVPSPFVFRPDTSSTFLLSFEISRNF